MLKCSSQAKSKTFSFRYLPILSLNKFLSTALAHYRHHLSILTTLYLSSIPYINISGHSWISSKKYKLLINLFLSCTVFKLFVSIISLVSACVITIFLSCYLISWHLTFDIMVFYNDIGLMILFLFLEIQSTRCSAHIWTHFSGLTWSRNLLVINTLLIYVSM